MCDAGKQRSVDSHLALGREKIKGSSTILTPIGKVKKRVTLPVTSKKWSDMLQTSKSH